MRHTSALSFLNINYWAWQAIFMNTEILFAALLAAVFLESYACVKMLYSIKICDFNKISLGPRNAAAFTQTNRASWFSLASKPTNNQQNLWRNETRMFSLMLNIR